MAARADGDGEKVLANGATGFCGFFLEVFKLVWSEHFLEVYSNDDRRGGGLFAWFVCDGGFHGVGCVARFVQLL